MNEPFINVLAGLLLSITCAACGRAALPSQPRPDVERRIFALDETHRATEHATDDAAFDAAAERTLRRMPDDSGLQDARAMRSGWAASDAR
jgi:DNA-binding IclR family transcriptional regulator